MKEFLKKANQFLLLTEELLNKKGFKKKEIAEELDMASPAFSSLYRTVLPELAKIDISSEDLHKEVKACFELVNNLSMKKITSSISRMNEILENLKNDSKKQIPIANIFQSLQKQSELSFEYIKENVCGLWDCFYYSSNKDMVKAEPLWIRPNYKHKTIEVLKGNKNNTLSYSGTAYLAGSHTLTIQLVETNVKLEETVMMYLSMPFASDINFMRGIFLALSYARQPIARRVVFKKVADSCDDLFYNDIETKYNLQDDNFEIMQYLIDKSSMIQNVQLLNPTFDEKDLLKEMKLLKQLNKA